MPDEHYMVVTPSGGLVLGGGVPTLERAGELEPDETLGVVDDSKVIPKVDKRASPLASCPGFTFNDLH